MTLLEMAQTNVIIGPIDFFRGRKLLNNGAENLEAFTIDASFVKTYALLERGLRPHLVVSIVFGSCRLEMLAGFIEGPLADKKILPYSHVRIETDLTARKLIQNGSPDFESLCFLVGLHARIPRFEEFLGFSVFGDGTAQGALCL